MDIVAPAAIVLAMCAGLGFLAMRTAGAGADVVMHMFRSPAELGWPTGVQEDDDLHWHWARARLAREDSSALDVPGVVLAPAFASDLPAVPELLELPDGAGPRPWPVART